MKEIKEFMKRVGVIM